MSGPRWATPASGRLFGVVASGQRWPVVTVPRRGDRTIHPRLARGPWPNQTPSTWSPCARCPVRSPTTTARATAGKTPRFSSCAMACPRCRWCLGRHSAHPSGARRSARNGGRCREPGRSRRLGRGRPRRNGLRRHRSPPCSVHPPHNDPLRSDPPRPRTVVPVPGPNVRPPSAHPRNAHPISVLPRSAGSGTRPSAGKHVQPSAPNDVCPTGPPRGSSHPHSGPPRRGTGTLPTSPATASTT